MSCSWNSPANIARAEELVREAAAKGAQIIQLPELFETPYFCIEQDSRHLALAQPLGPLRQLGAVEGLGHECPAAGLLGKLLR